ncbi:unnamed protein product [Rhizoctonia solani]|uniref:CFEM domain-containing protein n=1 Tax=Rhizoctonia solani TaxID=456999 RepID=A0A8H2W9R1_9AGAM|nr:unnamed protein product [Rhizoctonia solani]
MKFQLFFYLLFSLLFNRILAHEANEIVLGDLRTTKLFEPTPTSLPGLSPIETKIIDVITQHVIPSTSQTAPTVTATGDSGTAGGRTCVQGCLAQAASQVNCGGAGNFRCVCKKKDYVGKAWDCFGQMGCSGPEIGSALADLNVACQPFGRRNLLEDKGPESPMIVPASTPVLDSFESSRFDEL